MIFDPWLGGDLSDHRGKFDTRKEECPLVWGVLRGVGISAQAVNIISIIIIQIILTCSNKIFVLPIFRFAKRFYFLLSYKLIHTPYCGDSTMPRRRRSRMMALAREIFTSKNWATLMEWKEYSYLYLLKSPKVFSFVLLPKLVSSSWILKLATSLSISSFSEVATFRVEVSTFSCGVATSRIEVATFLKKSILLQAEPPHFPYWSVPESLHFYSAA